MATQGTYRYIFDGVIKMRKYLLAAASIVALSSVANAADMAPAPSVYDWSGVYIGLNAGVAWSNSEVDGDLNCSSDGTTAADAFCDDFDFLSDEFRHSVDDSSAVFSGGAMIGANWQWETFVLGVEADVNYANFGGSSGRDVEVPDGFFGTDGTPDYISTRAEVDANWWGTVRGRMGFAADNLLFYGTGGLAWGTIDASARVDYCFDIDCNGGWTARGSESDTLIGWTLGAGMEWGWDNWTFGAEYLYVDLGNADFDHRYDATFTPPDGVALDGNADVDYQFSVVRATAKWKF
jgi:outer membrane immunogenic protein